MNPVFEDSSRMPRIVNLAAYKFVTLDALEERRRELRTLCRAESLKGTVLLAPEGINLFVAGSRAAVDCLLNCLRRDERLTDLEVKESYSDHQPFERMLVKVKQEIIAFGIDGIDPRRVTSRKIPATQLRDWIRTGKEFVLLDVRNDYEVHVGTFENAVPIGVRHFREFPAAADRLPQELRDKPVVMFCTGGIRCEKAGPYLEQAGFREVHQLEGGILKYFEEVGGEFYQGDCFVFDKRVALDPQLHETETTQCYACLAPLSVEDQQSPLHDPPHACPHCYQSPEARQATLIRQRESAIRRITSPLPGSLPYDNPRPINVPARFDGYSLIDFLIVSHPHLGAEYWRNACDEGRILQRGISQSPERIVRGGEQFAHLELATTEPGVDGEIRILHEDDCLVVVNKPAPLPIHPSGRFHRNTLQWILNEAYRPWKLRPAHRLDANTTGVVVFCKTRTVSAVVQPQFAQGIVEKTYLARVHPSFGQTVESRFVCEAPISREPAECGGRIIDPDGLASRTSFERIETLSDGTVLLKAVPETGRTNQIRVHLWHLGLPVCGDPLYLPDHQFGTRQTLDVHQWMSLHAWTVAFAHPRTGARVCYEAPIPDRGFSQCGHLATRIQTPAQEHGSSRISTDLSE